MKKPLLQEYEQGVRLQYEEGEMGKVATVYARKKKGLWSRFYNWLYEADGEDTDLRLKAEKCYEDEYAIEQTALMRRYDKEESQSRQNELIQLALRDWKTATAYFESVSDPALIDYAAYDMEAAKRKYIYLLNSAKQRQVDRHMEYR
ncbi:MAG: YaaL family protein [Clostridiales bacterium]|jgi:hypothetical protein|nr:YaaL family protein [Clostridiales bacterium]